LPAIDRSGRDAKAAKVAKTFPTVPNFIFQTASLGDFSRGKTAGASRFARERVTAGEIIERGVIS